MTSLHVTCFSTVQITLDGEPITRWHSIKTRALLIYLAVEQGRAHRRESLAGLLWPDLSENRARRNLSQNLMELRRALRERANAHQAHSPFILSNTHTIELNPASDLRVDVLAFVDALKAVAAHNQHGHSDPTPCPTCAIALQQAAVFYTGPFLADFSLPDSDLFENWIQTQREIYHRQASDALTKLAAHHESTGNLEEAQQVTRRLLAFAPWQEEAHRRLMRLLAQSGQRSAALAQYDTLTQILMEELGVSPDSESDALYDQVLAGNVRREIARTALPLSSTAPAPLLVNTTPFMGREAEMALLDRRLAKRDYRLISLVGPGGIGKSRLALEVAHRNAHLFAQGVCFVSLAAVQQPADVPIAIATELGLTFDDTGRSPQQQLLAELRPRQLLLLLDNLEHLLVRETTPELAHSERVAAYGSPATDSTLIDFLIDLLRHAPALTLLATSREQLNLQAEDLHVLSGLPIPPTLDLATAKRFAAVQLFCDRAYRLQKSFALTDENLVHVVRICELVEGMPLGIELAATWIRDLDCAALAQALAESMDLLRTSLRDVAPQHHSIYAAYEHSWRLLTHAEQDALCQLAVFPGGFSAQAALDVAGATRLMLTRLGHKSLTRGAESGRYDMHSLLRYFSLEKLEEKSPQVQRSWRRHGEYYLHFVAQRRVALQGDAPQTALLEIRQELENIRQAWQWCIDNHHFAPLNENDCLTALIHFYDSSGLSADGERAFEQALRRVETTATNDPALRQMQQNLLAALAQMALAQTDMNLAMRRAEAALQMAVAREDVAGQAWGQQLLAAIYAKIGNGEAAREHGEAALLLARQVGAVSREGHILRNLGDAARDRGDLAEAERYFTQALQVHRVLGNRTQEQADLVALGMALMEQYNYAAAQGYLQEALLLIQTTGDRLTEARLENVLGFGLAALGRYEAALEHHQRSRQISWQIHNPYQESHALHNLCTVNRKWGRFEAAESYGREALRLGVEHNLLDPEACAWQHLGYLFLDSGRLAEAADAFARAHSGWLSLDQTHMAMEVAAGEAETALRQGRLAAALAKTETVLTYMAENSLEGADEPSQVYLSLYRVLHAHADPRAVPLLAEAQQLLAARANLLPDEESKQMFLLNVPAHRAITALVHAAA